MCGDERQRREGREGDTRERERETDLYLVEGRGYRMQLKMIRQGGSWDRADLRRK